METSTLLNSLIGHHVLSYCLFALCVLLLKVHIWTRVTQDNKSSLSEVPGPRLARWTRLWMARALMTGRSHEVWTETNAKYGLLARIGPRHVVTDDPAITRRILAARSGYERGPSFDSLRMDPMIPNVISERDGKKHAVIRAMVAPSVGFPCPSLISSCPYCPSMLTRDLLKKFTGRSIATIESVMDAEILAWVDSLRHSSSQVIDIGRRIQFLTVDIITRLCLGDAVGCTRGDRDMHGLLETVETGNRVVQYLSVFSELNTLLFSLSRVPVLRRVLFPNVTDPQGVGRLMGLVHEVAEKRSSLSCPGGGDGGTDDLVSALLARGMPAEQVDSEVIVALAGGSDTTSTSVQSTLLCIATNPHVYATLQSEMRAALRAGRISTPISGAEARRLVYLQAVVLEGLRKHPPLSQLRERVVPAGGDRLGGYYLPAGTLVGLNGWGAQLKTEVYGEDAALFRPERWLTGDQERLREMHACHSLIFGHGATRCLGVAMAMMEIPKVVFELLRNFDVSVADPHRPWTSRCYGIFHQEGFRVVLRPKNEDYC